jgi:hypothetical protein
MISLVVKQTLACFTYIKVDADTEAGAALKKCGLATLRFFTCILFHDKIFYDMVHRHINYTRQRPYRSCYMCRLTPPMEPEAAEMGSTFFRNPSPSPLLPVALLGEHSLHNKT